MNPLLASFLTALQPAVTHTYDECLHCTIAGNGSLAKAAGITLDTFPRQQHEDLLEALHETAITPTAYRLAADATGIHLFWLFNHVYLISPTATPDFEHAIQRMACRVEWGELWRIKRCAEPPLKPYAEALAFLRERLTTHPEWHKSALYPLLVPEDKPK